MTVNLILYVKHPNDVNKKIASCKCIPTNGLFYDNANYELLVVDYTRETTIMHPSPSSMTARILISGIDNTESIKLLNFGKFLKDRNKVGIIHVTSNSTSNSNSSDGNINKLYMLPPTNTNVNDITIYCNESLPPHTYVVKSANNSNYSTTSNTTTSNFTSTITTTTTTASSSANLGNDFLGGLLQAMENTNKALASAPPPVHVRTEPLHYIKALENRVRKEVARFDIENDLNELPFEPMEKDMRFVIHDIVEDMDDLVSASIGDDDDRHVVVYRKGHEPQDIELHLDNVIRSTSNNSQTTTVARKKQKSDKKALQKMLQTEDQGSFKSVNVLKRDRRSQEEIQAEMNNRKRLKD